MEESVATPKKDTMLEISIACAEAAHSGGVYTFFKNLVAICDESLKTRLRTEIDNSRGGVSLDTTRTNKLNDASVWWLQRLYVADWETEVRQDTLLKSYMNGVRQFRTGKGRHGYALTMLLESLCPLFEEFTLKFELPEEELVDHLPGESYTMDFPAYRFPKLVQARICWEKVYGPTEWPDDMDLSDAEYDEARAATQVALDARVEQRDKTARAEKREQYARMPLRHGDKL